MKRNLNAKWFPTIVIGGGQAGLAVGYHLAKRGLNFQILDSSLHIGDAWRNRWDSLRLFNPARYAGLPGLRFPGRGDAFPTKDQMADYLVAYAQRFRLRVQNGVCVDRLWKEGDRFMLAAGEERFETDNVVVAMANYQRPRVPAFAQDLDRGIVQMHANEYRNPSQPQQGGVLIVGTGNSGADIGIEVEIFVAETLAAGCGLHELRMRRDRIAGMKRTVAFRQQQVSFFYAVGLSVEEPGLRAKASRPPLRILH